MQIEHIEVSPITLNWSEWFAWEKFTTDARSNRHGITPPNSSGVYEVKLIDSEKRLTIGRVANLRLRIKQGLVKGKIPHSSGDDIRSIENTLKIVIRWALTDRPAAVEEELHKRYIATFGKLPKYTDRT